MTGYWDREPERYEVTYVKYRDAVDKAWANIQAFERNEAIVKQIDAELYENAVKTGGKASAYQVAESNKKSSPKRKRHIDACQFAMQKANMYSMYATAIDPQE